MIRQEFNNKVKEMFSDYEIQADNEFGSTFLNLNYEPKEYKCNSRDIAQYCSRYITQNRTNDKVTIKESGQKYVYVSSSMYPNEKINFWYCLFITKALFRGYRCKNWSDIELNKHYFSGKSLDELFDKIKEFKQSKSNNVY